MHWTVRLQGGPRRVNHSAIAVGHLIFSFGGYCTGEDFHIVRPIDIHVLNTLTLQWKKIEHEPCEKYAPYMRYGHSAVEWSDKAYIWGGRNDSIGADNTLYCYDTRIRKWRVVDVQDISPGRRDGHSACVMNNKMYIFGGFEEGVDRFSNDIYYFDLEKELWVLCQTKGSPPRWRDFHTATAIGDTMFIFGGRGDRYGPIHTSQEIYENTVIAYNTTRNEWSEILKDSSIAPVGRRSHSAWEYNGELYIFGGYNALQNQHFKELFKFNPVTRYWSEVRPLGEGPSARRRQALCRIGQHVFIFGGTSPSASSGTFHEDPLVDQNDLYVLDLEPSLKVLASLKVIEYKLDTTYLPHDVRSELQAMTTDSAISRPLNG